MTPATKACWVMDCKPSTNTLLIYTPRRSMGISQLSATMARMRTRRVLALLRSFDSKRCPPLTVVICVYHSICNRFLLSALALLRGIKQRTAREMTSKYMSRGLALCYTINKDARLFSSHFEPSFPGIKPERVSLNEPGPSSVWLGGIKLSITMDGG